jgi:hypothetical protein
MQQHLEQFGASEIFYICSHSNVFFLFICHKILNYVLLQGKKVKTGFDPTVL